MSKKAPDLVEATRTGLPPRVELDEREEAILDLAARQAADLAAAEGRCARSRLSGGALARSEGPQPLDAEARQGRLALGKLLGQLDLPESTKDAVRGAREAAEVRWGTAS